eukprot:TRINITY_DN123561_c0_g1_i1.p1 TRINITY_DN123561_c0_g1~~TRINITY_DN123561_c0_g1_i1.p1  ORF type:complete len:251 (+),score=34.03 TRINITY_DN123561_c0_g1_i1:91-753(+)
MDTAGLFFREVASQPACDAVVRTTSTGSSLSGCSLESVRATRSCNSLMSFRTESQRVAEKAGVHVDLPGRFRRLAQDADSSPSMLTLSPPSSPLARRHDRSFSQIGSPGHSASPKTTRTVRFDEECASPNSMRTMTMKSERSPTKGAPTRSWPLDVDRSGYAALLEPCQGDVAAARTAVMQHARSGDHEQPIPPQRGQSRGPADKSAADCADGCFVFFRN